LEIYLTEQIFDSLLNSLAVELKQHYGKELPVLIGVGISGIEIVGRLPSFLNAPKTEFYVCDVKRGQYGKIEEIVDFPSKEIKEKNVLIAYMRADTGKTIEKLYKHAYKVGAKDVKTMSIAVREKAQCFPNFFCFTMGIKDNLYLLIEGYPPDLDSSYPPIIIGPDPLLRMLKSDDATREWFECGDKRIDKFQCGEYLYFMKLSKRAKVYVLDDGKEILGVIHFSVRADSVFVETLAIRKSAQGRGLGSKTITFLIQLCKSIGISLIFLDAFREREGFYEALGFIAEKRFEIPKYGKFTRMSRKMF
jgi:GNAT superfamily N-acetyltransferase/hypoxanthine-guanine phosphoribosyltransferase